MYPSANLSKIAVTVCAISVVEPKNSRVEVRSIKQSVGDTTLEQHISFTEEKISRLTEEMAMDDQTSLQDQLSRRNEEIQRLTEELANKTNKIEELMIKVEYFVVGMKEIQKPRVNRAIGISAHPPNKNSKIVEDLLRSNTYV